MNPETYQHIQALLQSALEREPDERDSFLDEACAGDESLRRQVESLLFSHEQAGSFLESPAARVGAPLVNGARAKLAAGDAVGPYTILSRIGSGGMAEVYLAQDSRLGRKIALKLLPVSSANDAERVRRFRQEASAVSALNHPNILTIHEIGQTGSAHFIATEFIDGETLRQRLTRAQIPLTEAIDITIQIASALSAAHAAGIVHRDIKPENIMIRRDGYVKVLDFGLAKLTEQRASSSPTALTLADTGPGIVIGTVTYMSPEQARGFKVDERTDIFSFGVVLYEMLAGRAPFGGPTPSDVIVSILDREPQPLAHLKADVSPELQRIVTKALAKERDERYQTVKELIADMREFKRGLELAAHSLRTTAPSESQYASPEMSKVQAG